MSMRRAARHQPVGVGLLVTPGPGIRHQQRRQAGVRELGQHAGAGAAEREVRRGLGQAHLMMKIWKGLVAARIRQRRALRRHFRPVKFTGDVQHLQALRQQLRQHGQQGTVDAARAAAAAEDQQGAALRIEAEVSLTGRARRFCKGATQRVASYDGGHVGKPARRVRHGERDASDERAQQANSRARLDVRQENERGQTQQPGGQRDWQTAPAAGEQQGARSQADNQPERNQQAGCEAQKAVHAARPAHAGQGPGRDDVASRKGDSRARDQLCFEAAAADKVQRRLRAGLKQGLGGGQSGINVTAGAPRCDQDSQSVPSVPAWRPGDRASGSRSASCPSRPSARPGTSRRS